jgi:hypothetical protein
VLQNAIDKCNNPNDQTGVGNTTACPYLTVLDPAVSTTCKIKPIVNVRRVRKDLCSVLILTYLCRRSSLAT